MKRRALEFLRDLALRVGHHVLLTLASTWRLRHVGRERADRARFGSGPVIYAFTHGVLLPLVVTHRARGAVVLVSESRDGEIVARVLERLGHATVRGSSTRGGGRAVVQLVRAALEGRDLAITPDGPKGPRGSIAPGAALVASRSETPLVPLGVAADRAWRLRSWDRFLVPKPGARVAVAYGDPIRVARDADAAALEVAAMQLQEGIAAVERAAEDFLQRRDPEVPATRIPG